ncbi:gluconokinase [Shouchella shacheensis]|uniref:gluconokinase n=1 Tax=Shouchella shacheensis TaxID=1649580 RepID=UPI00073FC010|nr:gluconokinase [Shouchella shacheensis]
MKTYSLGLDLGTTSTKTVLFDEGLQQVASHEVEYPLLTPKPSWAEQDPAVILDAVYVAIREVVALANVLPEQITEAGISSAMHSLMAVDQDGEPLTRSIIWADNRSAELTAQLKSENRALEFYKRSGTPIHPMSWLLKLPWFQLHEKELVERTSKFISIKEYVCWDLFGEYVVDHSMATGTGLFSLRNMDWDEEALSYAGISAEKLSRPVATTYELPNMSQEKAEMLGLTQETRWIIGAGDGVLANVGVGALNPGEVAVTIGTSGAVRTVVDEPLIDEQGRTFCYALTEDRWVIGGPTNNGGMMLRWVRDEFSGVDIQEAERLGVSGYDHLMQVAGAVPAGAEGLLFLPFLNGERAPHWDPNARGVFFGIGMHHQRAHFIRAVMEGVLFSVYSVALALRDVSGQVSHVRASGGFAKSSFWRQMLADVMDKPVSVPETHNASALGAVVLARHALGKMKLEDVKESIPVVQTHEPNRHNRAIYDELFTMYTRLYEKLKEEFDEMTRVQQRYS